MGVTMIAQTCTGLPTHCDIIRIKDAAKAKYSYLLSGYACYAQKTEIVHTEVKVTYGAQYTTLVNLTPIQMAIQSHLFLQLIMALCGTSYVMLYSNKYLTKAMHSALSEIKLEKGRIQEMQGDLEETLQKVKMERKKVAQKKADISEEINHLRDSCASKFRTSTLTKQVGKLEVHAEEVSAVLNRIQEDVAQLQLNFSQVPKCLTDVGNLFCPVYDWAKRTAKKAKHFTLG